MRPLPRLFAVTDTAIVRREDFPVRAAAIASGGAAVAIVVRMPGEPAALQLATMDRVRALARPAEAAVFGHGDPAAARLAAAAGVQLRRSDLAPADARRVLPEGWIGVSIHQADEAREARGEGADYIVAGNVYATTSHPDRPPRGLDWLGGIAAQGGKVIAIGGISLERVAEVRDAGAWGVAAVSALWDAADPAGTVAAMLEVLAE